LLIEIGMWFENSSGESLEGAGALQIFASSPGLGLAAIATIVVSVIVLLFQAASCWFLGGVLFKSKEIE